jgi:hypothetical protein
MPYRDPEKQREADRRWRAANPEKAREANRKWREANPEKAREANRRWREANPEKCREQRQGGVIGPHARGFFFGTTRRVKPRRFPG